MKNPKKIEENEDSLKVKKKRKTNSKIEE